LTTKDGEKEDVSLAFLLLVFLGQQRSEILMAGYSQVKLVGILYDKINDTLIQYLQFLRFQTDSYSHFGMLLPKNAFRRLFEDYK
jgi:hypothetical protein